MPETTALDADVRGDAHRLRIELVERQENEGKNFYGLVEPILRGAFLREQQKGAAWMLEALCPALDPEVHEQARKMIDRRYPPT